MIDIMVVGAGNVTKQLNYFRDTYEPMDFSYYSKSGMEGNARSVRGSTRMSLPRSPLSEVKTYSFLGWINRWGIQGAAMASLHMSVDELRRWVFSIGNRSLGFPRSWLYIGSWVGFTRCSGRLR